MILLVEYVICAGNSCSDMRAELLGGVAAGNLGIDLFERSEVKAVVGQNEQNH